MPCQSDVLVELHLVFESLFEQFVVVVLSLAARNLVAHSVVFTVYF